MASKQNLRLNKTNVFLKMINFSNDWFFETTKALIGSSLLKNNFGFKWFQKIKIGYKSNILKIRAPEKLQTGLTSLTDHAVKKQDEMWELVRHTWMCKKDAINKIH
jgi:hypothetical protein